MTHGSDDAPVSMIERVVRVLDTFEGATRLSLAQVVVRSGLPRSSTHRILERLVAVRWLAREGRNYRLGLRMLELGSLVLRQNTLREAALPLMRRLSRVGRHGVHLAVLDRTEIVYLEKLGAPAEGQPLPGVGGRAPAYCTAAGKAILAYSDDGAVRRVVRGGLKARTRFTITDAAQFTRELQRVRERGVAFEREEAAPGVACVAAAVRGPGPAVAALSVCGPARQLDLVRLAPAVQQAAHGIWSATTARSTRPFRDGAEVPEGDWPPGALDAWTTWPRMTDWL